MAYELTLGNGWKFPTIRIPSALEEWGEEHLPLFNTFNGLSISEDNKNIYVEAALPGVEAKDIDVTYERGILTIQGTQKKEEKDKTYVKRASDEFTYRAKIDEEVDQAVEPEAQFQNGIMTVTFTKFPVKTKKITVKVKK